MREFTLIGVDPGIVHSGIVRLSFSPYLPPKVEAFVVDGPDPDAIAQAVLAIPGFNRHAFIEKYNDRVKGFKHDAAMRKLETQLMAKLSPIPAVLVNNSGVKKLVPKHTMEAIGCWDFDQKTHHQDLRSAARIALLGAAKDPALTKELFEYVYNIAMREEAKKNQAVNHKE